MAKGKVEWKDLKPEERERLGQLFQVIREAKRRLRQAA